MLRVLLVLLVVLATKYGSLMRDRVSAGSVSRTDAVVLSVVLAAQACGPGARVARALPARVPPRGLLGASHGL